MVVKTISKSVFEAIYKSCHMLASLLHLNSVILSPRPCFPVKAVCKNDGDNCPYDPTFGKG